MNINPFSLPSWNLVSLVLITIHLFYLYKNKAPKTWFVQDLKTINQIVVDTHMVVPTPHTINNFGDIQWFIGEDLKDAFFCIPLSPDTQN